MPETLFPTGRWFEALAEAMRAEREAYKGLGSIDCAMVVKVLLEGGRERLVEVVFEGFGARSVRELASLEEAAPSYFVIEGSLATWREMIENIRAHGEPDLRHTLNYLTLPDDPMRVSGPDQLSVDAFYRFNESLQRFFNASSRLPTAYA